VNRTGDTGVKLASMLIGAICAERRCRALLVDREAPAIAINRGGRGIDDRNLSTAPRRPRLIKNVDRAGQIDLMCAQPLSMGAGDRSNRGEMKATIDTLKRTLDSRRVGDIGFSQLDLLRQIIAVPAREIIEYSNRMAFIQQRMHQMRTDEPSAAGHEKASHSKSLRQLQERSRTMANLGRAVPLLFLDF